MITLEQLPSIVTHEIIGYLQYEDLLALSQANRYFQERVSDQVIKNLCLSKDFSDLSVKNRFRSRPVLHLSVILKQRASLVNNLIFQIERMKSLLDKFNLTKVGSLTVKILPEENSYIPWDITDWFYHSLLNTALESPLRKSDVKSLEIQTDFMCVQCRDFLVQLSSIKPFSRLKHLRINLVNFNISSTVGLYVHLFKIIFNIESLESFEIRNIDPLIYEELKLWFQPDNIYFSRIRSFTLSDRQTEPHCFILKFGLKEKGKESK